MKLKNTQIINKVRQINFIMLILFVALLFIWLMPVRVVTNIIAPKYLFTCFFALLFLILFRGNQYFEYDTVGEVFNLKTRNYGPLSILGKSEKSVDVPLDKVVDYRFNNYFGKRQLFLFIKSKKTKTGLIKLKFDMSYLTQKEYKSIRNNLEKIVNNNNRIDQEKLKNNFLNTTV